MASRSRPDLYAEFIGFIRSETEKERSRINRQLLNVFLWCFFVPTVMWCGLLVLIRLGMVPRSIRGYLDWIMVLFPVLYSLRFLSFEVLREAPRAFRIGGLATSLEHARKEGQWRAGLIEGLLRALGRDAKDWAWVVENYRIDLANLRNRTRYMTGLAGAVIFLIMQGIDSIFSDSHTRNAWVMHPGQMLEESSNGIIQFVGLAFFLVMLYLSGIQIHHSLRRYLSCAELASLEAGNPPATDRLG